MDDLQKATAQAIVNIFETGSILGNYGAVTVIKGDSGHLTYGRSQTTLGSGNLYKLLLSYCRQSNALFAAQLRNSTLKRGQWPCCLATANSSAPLIAKTEQVLRAPCSEGVKP